MISTRLFVSFGIPVMNSGGFIFSPSQVYREGMCPPAVKAELLMFRMVFVSVVMAGTAIIISAVHSKNYASPFPVLD
jgi:hypothetical protein